MEDIKRNKRIYTIEYHQKCINDLINEIIKKLKRDKTSYKVNELYMQLITEFLEILKTNPDDFYKQNYKSFILKELNYLEAKDPGQKEEHLFD